MDPWEKFQARKAADKLTMMHGKLRESTSWIDQLNLDPWEKFQALRAADKLSATRRQSTRGTGQLRSDILRQIEREDVRVTSSPSESLTTPFVCSRRPVGTPDHVTSLGHTGVYQPRTMQTESRGLSTLYYSSNFARETGLHTLQQQRLRGSTGPFSDVEDWFASKYMRAPKQELYKSSAKQRTTTQDILGVYPSSYGAQDFTDRSSTGTDTESMDAESTDDTSSDVSELSYCFNSSDLDELFEDSGSTVDNWNKDEEPQNSTTVQQLYSLTLPISGGYMAKPQSRNVTVSHILAPKQDNPCVKKCTDDSTAFTVTDTVTDKSVKSSEQQKTSTEGDVNGHPSSPEEQNNIDDLFTLTEPMPARATDDTSSYVPRLIYPLTLSLEEMSDDCDSIITEAVDIPKSEIEESFTIDKTSNGEDCNETETREGASNFAHQVGGDNPEIINSCAFKDDVKSTEQESMESNVSPSIPLTEDRLKEIPAPASDTKPDKIEPETLINETKTTEQVVSTPETPETKGDTASCDKSTQTEQDHLQQRQVKEEVIPEAVPKERTCGSDETAFPETSSEDIKKGCISYSRHVLCQDERVQDKETEPQQASGERSTVCEITELRCSGINGQSDRHTDRSNLEILDKVKQDIKDTGSNMNLEKIQTTDYQEVTDKENKNRPKEEERVKISTMEIEGAPRQEQMELTNERIENNLDEFRKRVEEQITANQKLNDTEGKNKQEKEERVKRNILETEETLRQEDTGLGYERIEKYLEEFKKKLEEQYVGSRPDTSFVRGGDINVTVQCGVLNTKHVLPPTGNQPVSAENATSAYRKDGHENDPKCVCPQTGPWVDKRAKRQTRHIKKCRNCGSTSLDTVSESSGLILGTSVSQRSPRFLIDSVQGDPSAYCKERGRERTARSPMSAEQSIVHDKTRASNTTRIGGQRESQQRKSRLQKLRYREVDPCATDPGKNRHSRKVIKEGVLNSPTTSQSPPSLPTETKETDTKLEREEIKRNVLKRKKSEDKYKVRSENEPGSAQSQKKTKPSHSKTLKPKDDFTDIFATETIEYQCPTSDEANETSSCPKDSTIIEASSLRSTGSINSDTNGKSGRKNVNATEIKPEASPKAHRDKSSSTSKESSDSTDNDHKSKNKRTGKYGTRLKRSTEPTKTTAASPKAHRDKSSSTSSESDESTDSDSIPKRKRTGKSGRRLKRSIEQTKTRKPEVSAKGHKDGSSSTSSESDDSTNRIKTSEVKKEKEAGSKKDVKSKRKIKNLPPVISTSTVELTDQCISEVKQTTQDSEPSSISSNNTEDSESTDDDTVYSETEDNDDDEKGDNKQKNVDKINEKEKRKKEIAELKKKLEEVIKIDKSEKRSQENQKKEQKTMEKLDKELDKKRKEIEKVNLKREQRQIKNEKDEEKNALKEENKIQKMQMKQEKEEQSKIKKEAKKAENEEKKLEKLRNKIKKVEDKQVSKKIEENHTDESDDDDDYDDDDDVDHGNHDTDEYDNSDHIVNAYVNDCNDIVEGDGEEDKEQTNLDKIKQKEKRKNEIAELKKKLEEVKKIDKSEKRSQENQKKEQKTMGKLDKELEKKRKEIEKVNLKREQRQIKKEKDEEKNALKEEKKLQKMQMKQEKEEQSKIKKKAKKAENEEKKLEKLRNEIKKVEDKQASKKVEQTQTDEKDDDDDDNDDDDDDRCYVGDHKVNDTFSDSDDFGEGDDDDENKQTEHVEMDGKVDVKNKIAELKEKFEEGKRLEKAEKRSRETQKKDEQAKKKLDKKQEREKNKLEEVARKKEQQRIKDERNKNVKLLQEKKKFLEKQIKQKKKEQAKIQKEAKKAAKDAEKERKKSHKTQKDVQKKEQKKALKKEEKHSNEKDDEDDLDSKVSDYDSDHNDDEGNDDENKQTKSETMIEHADVIQDEIAELKEELEEVKMTEETQKRQIKSDEKNEQAIEKLDKEMEREKKKMEEIDRKLELKQKKIEKDEEKKMLKEEKTIFEKLMKEEKKEQSRITKEAKKAEKEKEKGRKKAEKEVEKDIKKAEQEKEKQRKKVEKEQKDAQKKEEKEAKKAAEKEQKESAKVVKKREKEQKEKEKREKMRKKKEQQKEKKREKEKQKEESKLLAFRRKKKWKDNQG